MNPFQNFENEPTTEALLDRPIKVEILRQNLSALYLFYDRLQKWAKRHKVQNVPFIKGATPLRKEIQYALAMADRNKRLSVTEIEFQHPVHKELAKNACVVYRSIIVQLHDCPKTRHISDLKDEFDDVYVRLENIKRVLEQC